MGVAIGVGLAVAGAAAGAGAIFGGAQKARAAKEASRMIAEARQQGIADAAALRARYDPFLGMSKGYLESAGEQLTAAQQYLAAEGSQIEVGQGLTAADEIAYKDAARLLNENMVGTGNLRSGAAAFGQTELLRRVVADANQRNFERRIVKLQTLFGGMAQGAQQFGNLGQFAGQLGAQGDAMATNLLTSAMGLAPAQGNAILAKGAAQAESIMGGASIVGSIGSGMVGGMNAANTSQLSNAMTNYYNSQNRG